jgi:hypothetical protein
VVTAERDEELRNAGEAQLTALVRASVKNDKVGVLMEYTLGRYFPAQLSSIQGRCS